METFITTFGLIILGVIAIILPGLIIVSIIKTIQWCIKKSIENKHPQNGK